MQAGHMVRLGDVLSRAADLYTQHRLCTLFLSGLLLASYFLCFGFELLFGFILKLLSDFTLPLFVLFPPVLIDFFHLCLVVFPFLVYEIKFDAAFLFLVYYF